MKKILNYCLVLIMLIGNTYLLIRDFSAGDNTRIPTYIALYPLLLVPNLFKKFINFKISVELEVVY